jgi:hypothetical protein
VATGSSPPTFGTPINRLRRKCSGIKTLPIRRSRRPGPPRTARASPSSPSPSEMLGFRQRPLRPRH